MWWGFFLVPPFKELLSAIPPLVYSLCASNIKSFRLFSLYKDFEKLLHRYPPFAKTNPSDWKKKNLKTIRKLEFKSLSEYSISYFTLEITFLVSILSLCFSKLQALLTDHPNGAGT